jgi:hypothetical protein
MAGQAGGCQGARQQGHGPELPSDERVPHVTARAPPQCGKTYPPPGKLWLSESSLALFEMYSSGLY